MTAPVEDTIVALATAPRPARRAILRASGPCVLQLARRWFHPEQEGMWQRSRTYRQAGVYAGWLRLLDPTREDHRGLPCWLYLWPTDRSYTRQPTLEFHTPGAMPLLQRALSNFCSSGARLAEPGEFTLRAFLAGRIDLTQAEAVLGVIDARSTAQFQTAVDQLAGGLSRPLRQLLDQLLNLAADLEAGLDFVDEPIEFITRDQLTCQLQAASEQLLALSRTLQGRTVAGPFGQVVFLGSPNAGKSSLINRLVGAPVSLVSPLAGTTRDYVTAEVEWQGMPCELIDTAGQLRESRIAADTAAQAMTAAICERATVRVICLDSSRPPTEEERSCVARRNPQTDLVVLTKADLPAAACDLCPDLRTSALTGQGLEALRERIVAALEYDAGAAGECVSATAARCQAHVRRCEDGVRRAWRLAKNSAGEELVAAELRTAIESMGHVLGTVCTDDILDRIFSRFCLGK